MKLPFYLLLTGLLLGVIPGKAQTLYRTACQGKLARLDSLLSQNDVNAQDANGRTMLHWAVACEQSEVIDYLLERGIYLNTLDHDGVSAMYMAVRFNNRPLFDRLLALQPNADWTTIEGALMVERAILDLNADFVEYLIALGVPINAQNKRGSTPLEIARKTKAKQIADLLLSQGADPSLMRQFKPAGAYMGEQSPGSTPLPFAPNFISTEEYEFGSVFNASGTEFYYGVDVRGKAETRYTALVDGYWTPPVTILSHEQYGYNDPFLSPDENRLYVISDQPPGAIGESKDHDIWYVEREGAGWSEPINAGPNINADGSNEYFISFTQDGTMYFSSNINAAADQSDNYDIYYSRFADGKFQPKVALSEAINTPAYEADVFVSPDETYLIFCSTRDEGLGRGDLYISFKNREGVWSEAVHMDDTINTSGHELCPYVTADGKYFFYTSNQDIYWVEASILEQYRTR